MSHRVGVISKKQTKDKFLSIVNLKLNAHVQFCYKVPPWKCTTIVKCVKGMQLPGQGLILTSFQPSAHIIYLVIHYPLSRPSTVSISAVTSAISALIRYKTKKMPFRN